MDGVAKEKRERLEAIEHELEDVKRRLPRIWQLLETTDIEMADASDRIREHRERQRQLEDAAQEARAVLAERRELLDSADMVAAFAADMNEFRRTSELALNGGVMNSVQRGGAGGNRTRYLFNAIEALSQMSYSPTVGAPSAYADRHASILPNLRRNPQPRAYPETPSLPPGESWGEGPRAR